MTEQTELRPITQDDIYLKARLISEGVNVIIKKAPERPEGSAWKPLEGFDDQSPASDIDSADTLLKKSWQLAKPKDGDTDTKSVTQSVMTLDGSGLKAPAFQKAHSVLDLIVDGDDLAIEERGEVLGTAKFLPPIKREWSGMKLSNGLPIEVALPDMSSSIINLLFNWSCNNVNTGVGCRYCSLFINSVSKRINNTPIDTLNELGKFQAEAIKTLHDHGWRGAIALSGGALPPGQRSEYLERMDAVLSPVRDAVGDEVFDKMTIVYNHYPPENFNDMHDWKEYGVKGTSIDLEVADPAYFPAICPGKNAYKPHEYWVASHDASVEVFGAFKTTTNFVMGIEPMESLVEGVDNCLGRGVFPVPLTFQPAPGSPYDGFRTPTAEWLMETSDRIVNTTLKHAGKVLQAAQKASNEGDEGNPFAQNSKGDAPKGHHLTIVFDDLAKRFQGMRKRN